MTDTDLLIQNLRRENEALRAELEWKQKEIELARLSSGVTVQEWIPVTERMPENIANRVLVVCEGSNGVFYAHYEKPFWINLETDKPFISTVTHWMLLPELPKGANDAESVD